MTPITRPADHDRFLIQASWLTEPTRKISLILMACSRFAIIPVNRRVSS
jgi:hypothetical protein